MYCLLITETILQEFFVNKGHLFSFEGGNTYMATGYILYMKTAVKFDVCEVISGL